MPLSKSDDMGKWIKDFEKSDAPQFAGKSKEHRRKMAIAAKLNAEEVADMSDEQLMEFITYLPKTIQEEIKTALGLNEKRGLWDNIHAKRKRIKAGSGERMRKPGEEGAPSDKDLRDSQKEETELDEDITKMSHSRLKFHINGVPHGSYTNNELKAEKERRIKTGEGDAYKKAKPGLNESDDTLDEKQGPCWKGYKKVPGKKDYEDGSCVKEEYISEATDKLLYLARIGLVNRNEVVLLRKALKVKSSGETISPRYRDVMLKVMDKLINMIVNNQMMFNKARKEVREEVEVVNLLEEVLLEAGYNDPPKNMKEFRKRYPNLKRDIKSTDSGDFNRAVTTSTVSESYINYLNLIK